MERHGPVTGLHRARMFRDLDERAAIERLDVTRTQLRDLVDPGACIGTKPRHPASCVSMVCRHSFRRSHKACLQDDRRLIVTITPHLSFKLLPAHHGEFLRGIDQDALFSLGISEHALGGGQVHPADRVVAQFFEEGIQPVLKGVLADGPQVGRTGES